MVEKNNKVILITGASAGIGRASALELARQGHRVYGTSRTLRGVTDEFTMLPMDVDDAASVQAAVKTVLDREGRIDVVVNNAGFGYSGSVEDTAIEEARDIFETNFFGVMRVCHAVLPAMRAQRSGTIINVSSIGGLIALPYRGLYSATKYALEGLSEALRMEVKHFGLHVVLLEPGDLSTEFGANRRKARGAGETSAYRDVYQRVLVQVEESDRTGDPPESVARVVRQIVDSPHPRARYAVGPFIQKFAIVLKRLLPAAIFERLLMQTYDVS